MHYAIRHVTRYRYSSPISESHLQLRMQPKSEGGQLCWDFQVRTHPRAKVDSYRDSLGNAVHFFDVPARHSRLTIIADARVEQAPIPWPHSLDAESWAEYDALSDEDDYWEMLAPSTFARSTPLLQEFKAEHKIARGVDPLTTLIDLKRIVYDAFEYTPRSTRVDSPIDDALRSRRGVCQDFTHILIALARDLGIPCRYVSGYLYHGQGDPDRSTPGATHAWVEALLPRLGWIGFDPTNNLLASDRHLRVAVGRDYDDVPPTRGVYTGDAGSELAVDVKVELSEAPIGDDVPTTNVWVGVEPEDPSLTVQQAAQQQQ